MENDPTLTTQLVNIILWVFTLGLIFTSCWLPVFIGAEMVEKWWNEVKNDERSGLQVAINGDNTTPALHLVKALGFYTQHIKNQDAKEEPTG